MDIIVLEKIFDIIPPNISGKVNYRIVTLVNIIHFCNLRIVDMVNINNTTECDILNIWLISFSQMRTFVPLIIYLPYYPTLKTRPPPGVL